MNIFPHKFWSKSQTSRSATLESTMKRLIPKIIYPIITPPCTSKKQLTKSCILPFQRLKKWYIKLPSISFIFLANYAKSLMNSSSWVKAQKENRLSLKSSKGQTRAKENQVIHRHTTSNRGLFFQYCPCYPRNWDSSHRYKGISHRGSQLPSTRLAMYLTYIAQEEFKSKAMILTAPRSQTSKTKSGVL